MGIPIREGPARARCTLQTCFRAREQRFAIAAGLRDRRLQSRSEAPDLYLQCWRITPLPSKTLWTLGHCRHKPKRKQWFCGRTDAQPRSRIAHAAPWSVLARVEAAVLDSQRDQMCCGGHPKLQSAMRAAVRVLLARIRVYTQLPVAAPLFAGTGSSFPVLAALVAFGCSRVKCYQAC
jgi:hypothetical protein